MNVRPEPFICEAGDVAARPVREFLFRVGIEEKHWPADEVRALLDRDSVLVGVFAGSRFAGAAQILYERPYPCECPPFLFCIPDGGRVPCEVTFIAVDPQHRRSAGDHGVAALDALVKGLYRYHRDEGGTHIYTLCEQWTFNVLTRGYVKINGRLASDGMHYWCGTAICPGPDCQPTSVCELDMRESEKTWQAERPDFWEYLNQ